MSNGDLRSLIVSTYSSPAKMSGSQRIMGTSAVRTLFTSKVPVAMNMPIATSRTIGS